MSVTIHQLRQKGFKVKVHHLRYDSRSVKIHRKKAKPYPTKQFIETGEQKFIFPRGGITTVEILCPDGQTLAGESNCSLKDGFKKKVGVHMALGRALKGTTYAVQLP